MGRGGRTVCGQDSRAGRLPDLYLDPHAAQKPLLPAVEIMQLLHPRDLLRVLLIVSPALPTMVRTVAHAVARTVVRLGAVRMARRAHRDGAE